MKKLVQIGYTNKKKYFEDNHFVVEKTFNGFNHRLDYAQTQVFPFVPKLIKNTESKLVWQKIDGEQLINPTNRDLQKVAIQLRKIHLSNIKLPKNNLRKRVQSYLKIIHQKNQKLPFIERHWKKMMNLLSNMQKINPCHNDVWFENLLKTKDKQIYFVDWEYATMGDKHFDLAFFIKSQKLNSKQIHVFLKAYDSVENQKSYDENLLEKYYLFGFWITVCWAYAQEQMPFELDWMIKELEK